MLGDTRHSPLLQPRTAILRLVGAVYRRFKANGHGRGRCKGDWQCAEWDGAKWNLRLIARAR